MEHVEFTDTSPCGAHPATPRKSTLQGQPIPLATMVALTWAGTKQLQERQLEAVLTLSYVSKISPLHPVSLCRCLVSQICTFSFISNPKSALQRWVRNQPDKIRPAEPFFPFREQTQIISH